MKKRVNVCKNSLKANNTKDLRRVSRCVNVCKCV